MWSDGFLLRISSNRWLSRGPLNSCGRGLEFGRGRLQQCVRSTLRQRPNRQNAHTKCTRAPSLPSDQRSASCRPHKYDMRCFFESLSEAKKPKCTRKRNYTTILLNFSVTLCGASLRTQGHVVSRDLSRRLSALYWAVVGTASRNAAATLFAFNAQQSTEKQSPASPSSPHRGASSLALRPVLLHPHLFP